MEREFGQGEVVGRLRVDARRLARDPAWLLGARDRGVAEKIARLFQGANLTVDVEGSFEVLIPAAAGILIQVSAVEISTRPPAFSGGESSMLFRLEAAPDMGCFSLTLSNRLLCETWEVICRELEHGEGSVRLELRISEQRLMTRSGLDVSLVSPEVLILERFPGVKGDFLLAG